MHDLRTTLRTISNSSYRVQHTNACTTISPVVVYVNRVPPPQDLIAQVLLKADRYSINWRCSSETPSCVQRAELCVFFGDLTEPALVYDLRVSPELSVVFRIPKSSAVYVMLRIQSKAIFRVHTLHVMNARDHVVGYDPLMHEWDMEKVAVALHQQSSMRLPLSRLMAMFEWDHIKKNVGHLLDKWRDVFDGNTPTDHQRTVLHCRMQAPNLLATSRDSQIGSFRCDEHSE